MYTNACGMANTQSIKYSTTVRIKTFNAAMTKYFLLQQLPYFIEGLLFHRYLPIIYPSAIQYQTGYAAANANTPSLFPACCGQAMLLLHECCCHYLSMCVAKLCRSVWEVYPFWVKPAFFMAPVTTSCMLRGWNALPV